MNAFSPKPRAVLLAVLASLALVGSLVVGPAEAATRTFKDRSHDELDTQGVPEVNIGKVTLDSTARRFKWTVRLGNISADFPADLVLRQEHPTQVDAVHFETRSTWEDAHAKTELYYVYNTTDEGRKRISCEGLRSRWDADTDRVTVTIPTKCRYFDKRSWNNFQARIAYPGAGEYSDGSDSYPLLRVG